MTSRDGSWDFSSASGRTWEPPGVDTARPSVARIYDYALGGKDNFEVDRAAYEHQILPAAPEMSQVARENRDFLIRAVDHLARTAGLRQFIDFGSGLPTQDNVHQVAQRVDPGARVVYVDNDPMVLAHGRAILGESDSTLVIPADLARPDDVLNDPGVRGLIDLDEPLGVLFVSVLHCVPDEDDPGAAVRRMVDVAAPGSHLVLSHVVSHDPEKAQSYTDVVKDIMDFGRIRSEPEVRELFTGLEVIAPGLGDVSGWYPGAQPTGRRDDTVAEKLLWEMGGVGRKT